ncbi:dihydroorotate dehydrogenase electron transfer subunit [Geobacillus stearothermophilus]|nr:dihydroorotate dehydrogenase electron transfer subunit [Geobacillus stearothermophilus]
MIGRERMTVASQRLIAERTYELTLSGRLVQEMKQPGQFVHVKAAATADPLLRRPLSLCRIDRKQGQCTIIYRQEGKGTALLAQKQPGDVVDVLGPLGNGFPLEAAPAGGRALLVGGGIGVPPLYELAKQLTKRGVKVVSVLGFQTKAAVFYEEEFAAFGETHVATDDGSHGTAGRVTDVIEARSLEFDVLYACGPKPMLRALAERFPNRPVYVSLEERMGCGVGACFACVCHVPGSETAYKKVCSDGPVFRAGEVVL